MQNSIPPEVQNLLDPKTTAVLVVDKQHGYIDQDSNLIKQLQTDTTDLREMVPKIDDFIRKARQHSVPVVWTKMLENSEESIPPIAFKIRLLKDDPITKTGEQSFEIIGEQPLEIEKVIIKHRYDSFIGTDLNQYLRDKGITSVILVGGYASRCVLATGFAANSFGYNVIMVEDLVGNPASYSDELLLAQNIVNAVIGFVISASALITCWETA